MKKRFIELKATGQRFAMTSEQKEKDLQLIHYLKAVVENSEVSEFEDMGFCYWNISDNYALIKDGYSDFWWKLYHESTEQNLDYDYCFVEFCAHRAALYINPILSHTHCNLESAKLNFEKFLQKVKHTPEYQFYKVIYLSLVSRFSSFDKIELKSLCDNLFNGLSHPKTTNGFLIGEWRNFVTPFDIRKQSVVGINSAINAFIYNGEIQTAKEIYKNACDIGLPKNHYIEIRLK